MYKNKKIITFNVLGILKFYYFFGFLYNLCHSINYFNLTFFIVPYIYIFISELYIMRHGSNISLKTSTSTFLSFFIQDSYYLGFRISTSIMHMFLTFAV